jgi:hypothetical protein
MMRPEQPTQLDQDEGTPEVTEEETQLPSSEEAFEHEDIWSAPDI